MLIVWINYNFSAIITLMDIFKWLTVLSLGYTPRSEITGWKDGGIFKPITKFYSKSLNHCTHLPAESQLICFSRSLKTTLVLL